MRITRCQDQKSQTLDEFYAELGESEQPVYRAIGQAMLSLLARLRALPDDRHVWGLTSHSRLGLLATDSYESPSLVKFLALNEQHYLIEYLMPERVAPWPQAYVKGHAHSGDEAVQMIQIAMEKSEGWSEAC